MSENSVVHVERPAGALALTDTQREWTPAQRAALVQLGLDQAPEGDLQVFLHYAQRTGLDPFARQIYMIGRWDGRAGRQRYTIQSSIDGLRIVAERHGQYGGQDGPYWCGDDGQWTDVWISKKPPVAAKVGVLRKDWAKPAYAVAKFDEYAAKRKDGSLEGLWASKPCVMIAKCAEALALRKAFPHDLSGIYTADEMAQADNPPLRVVIDQAPDEAEPQAVPAEAEVDWDAEIAACGDDKVKLGELWKRAPRDSEARVKIAAAAKAVGQKKAEPQIIEAEVIKEPAKPAKPTTFGLGDLVDQLLAAGTVEQVEALANTVDPKSRAARENISGIVPKDAAAELRYDKNDKITAPEFADLVLGYVAAEGYSVNEGIKIAAEQGAA